MILNLWRTNPSRAWLDVILYYTSSTLNMSELCSTSLLRGRSLLRRDRLGPTRRFEHHSHIDRLIELIIEHINVMYLIKD
uniref:Uncharacterized protein n=1 Tax=viral metagenome TaxID=1070528 RepID=A0A6C0BLV0_9ZZZZ